MSFSESISPLVGRWALGWYFLYDAWQSALHWSANVQLMAMQGLPAAPPLLALGLLLMILGGLSLVLGCQARIGAVLLFAVIAASTVLMHNFWVLNDPADRAADFQIFAANVAIAGGLLLVTGLGPGRFSFEGGGKRR